MKQNKNCKHTICMYYHVCKQYEAKWCVWIMDCMYPDLDEVIMSDGQDIPEEFVRRDVPLQTCMNCEFMDLSGEELPCACCGLMKEGWRAKAI